MTNFEVAENADSEGNSENTISGYFRAPVDGNYKFHMSCSKKCKLYLGGLPVGEIVDAVPDPPVSTNSTDSTD